MRRRSIVAVSIGILALTWSVCRLGADFASPQRAPKGTKMNTAVIATFPVDPAVLSGQALMVRTLFDNRGPEPAQAPSSRQMSDYVYILQSQAAGGPEYGLSAL